MSNVLTDKQGQVLLELARKTLQYKMGEGTAPAPPEDPALSMPAATFVTLKIAGQLRGCIGNLEPAGPLWQGIRDNAINAAFNDYRFSPLRPEELPAVHVDISILSQPEFLAYRDPEELLLKLRPGVDGVILRDGRRSATFLPQVWQQLAATEQFLEHLCQKAGLPGDVWRQKKLEIYTYQVQCFEEEKK
ncbi:AmmeMemoRadiSam system protein A [Desulfopila sp. IMCC35006]|uniref:AmmeMemoRadiSam system protein A n=1 Tax=Desulfopila sp. IMCC35006 TaxID=2569542 RepID=UPI0010AD0009|nr:AmmeMemoRadiSam system protein A [Desulfopila sp. IMCC35006]TKB26274.1 AmmeMemoRadiSam system protein A [Desulfopila sp. IMCC35006]